MHLMLYYPHMTEEWEQYIDEDEYFEPLEYERPTQEELDEYYDQEIQNV